MQTNRGELELELCGLRWDRPRWRDVHYGRSQLHFDRLVMRNPSRDYAVESEYEA